MNTLSRLTLCVGFTALLASACGSDDGDDGDSAQDEAEATPECAAITDACHMVDPGTPGDIYTCHSVIAHENDAAECAKEKDRCIALCKAAEASES